MPDDVALPETSSAPPHERPGLWRHRGFLLLWGGQSVSALGSQITIWVFWSPVKHLRAQPTAPDEQAFASAPIQ